MFEIIRADLDRKVRGYGVRPQDKTFFRKRITPFLEFGTIGVVVYRFGRWVYSIKIPVIRQIMIFVYLVVNTLCMAITGIHIQRESDIGPGLVIHNFCNVMVLVKRMGHSCTLNQGVTVGSVRGTGWPTIGNNVYFGTGCKVMGGVTVGDNVVVSANSLVVADVPGNCTVMGVPARIISRDAASPYLKTAITPQRDEARQS
ncbi:MAG: serine acetyltransferase [Chthoniobacterales bacterium]|jgi:serine O-acetyltransferase|nr:serine acetyltransferase [Chthoniobacterales bacterium]